MPAAGSQQQRLIELQQRVFDEVCSTPADRMVALHCALRAQQATPSLGQRAVLGVLPRIMLQLPDDPSGILHSMSCLAEAVMLGNQEEQAADSEDCTGQHAHTSASKPAPVAVRLTLYASAGAVACWQEGPADPMLSLTFSTVTRVPIWSSGPGGFAVHFPHAFCPQVDLFLAIHQHVAELGSRVLQPPPLSLDVGTMWCVGAGQGQSVPPAAFTLAPSMPDPMQPVHLPLAAVEQHLPAGRSCRQQQEPVGQLLPLGPLVASGALYSAGGLPSDAGFSFLEL